MHKYLLIAATIVGLAACSGSKDEQAAANAAAEATPPLMQPGEWEITHKVTGYNHDGLTKEEYDAKLGETATARTCITNETADRPDANFLASNQGTECKYENLTPTTGRLSATLACKSGSGTINLLLDGNNRDGVWMLAEQSTMMAQGKPTVRASADVTVTRLGDCPAPGTGTTAG